MIPKSAIKPGSSFWEVNDSRFLDVDVAVGDPLGEKFINLADGSPVALVNGKGGFVSPYVDRLYSYEEAASMLCNVEKWNPKPSSARVKEHASSAQSYRSSEATNHTTKVPPYTIAPMTRGEEWNAMRTAEQIEASNREIDRRIEERKARDKELARAFRRRLIRDLPRNALLLTAAVLAMWAIKSCESKDHAADPDRTGINGMPY